MVSCPSACRPPHQRSRTAARPPSVPAMQPQSAPRRRGQGRGGASRACGHRDTPTPDSPRSAPPPRQARPPGTAGGAALEPLGLAGVAAHPTSARTHRDCQPGPDCAAGPAQPLPLRQQVLAALLPLVVGGAGDRPGPAAGRRWGQGALAVGALIIAPAEPAASGEILPGQAAKLLADRTNHCLVAGGQAQPGADAGTRRWGDHKRGGQATHQPTTRSPSPWPSPSPRAAAASPGPTSRSAQRTAFSARLRADRRPYSRAQKLVSTSTRSRIRSLVTSPSSSTTNRRPCAQSAASTNSAFIRASRSRCVTTTVRTAGSASSRRSLGRRPVTPRRPRPQPEPPAPTLTLRPPTG